MTAGTFLKAQGFTVSVHANSMSGPLGPGVTTMTVNQAPVYGGTGPINVTLSTTGPPFPGPFDFFIGALDTNLGPLDGTSVGGPNQYADGVETTFSLVMTGGLSSVGVAGFGAIWAAFSSVPYWLWVPDSGVVVPVPNIVGGLGTQRGRVRSGVRTRQTSGGVILP